MPSARPTLSTWISWPSPTGSSSEVSGANGSERWRGFARVGVRRHGRRPSPACRRRNCDRGIGCCRRRPRLGLLEDLLMHRRQRAGRIGIAGIAGQRKGLAAAAAEIDFAELAALARLRHPAGAAIAVEGLGVLPDPGDRMIGAHRFEFEPGDALRGVAGQDLAGRRNVEELPAPAAHAFLRPQRIIVRHHIVDGEHALQPHLAPPRRCGWSPRSAASVGISAARFFSAQP